jgi:hypothetical protein
VVKITRLSSSSSTGTNQSSSSNGHIVGTEPLVLIDQSELATS